MQTAGRLLQKTTFVVGPQPAYWLQPVVGSTPFSTLSLAKCVQSCVLLVHRFTAALQCTSRNAAATCVPEG